MRVKNQVIGHKKARYLTESNRMTAKTVFSAV